MQSREFAFSPNFNLGVDNLLVAKNFGFLRYIPLEGAFLLMDGENFLLMDGEEFALMGA